MVLAGQTEQGPRDSRTGASTTPSCILSVDDEPESLEVTDAILAREGYSVRHAGSGHEALAAIAQGGVDLVLLDVLMPGIDGVETCARIREQLEQCLLPVIMVTALSDSASRIRGKAAGADDFLSKPVDPAELLARVSNLLKMRAYYRLMERQRADAEAEARRWKLVSQVSHAVAMSRDYTSLQRSIVESLLEDLRVETATLFEFDDDDLPEQSSLGVHPSAVQPEKGGSGARGAWLEALGDRRVLPVATSLARGTLGAPRVASGPSSALVIPVYIGGLLEGLLGVARQLPFQGHELALMEDLSPHLANAIANVRAHMKAQQLRHARERLSTLLVHDLRSPLSAITGNLNYVRDVVTDPECRDALTDACTAADQLSSMTSDLIDIGLAEEGRFSLRREPVDVGAFVDETLAQQSMRINARGVQLTTHLARDVHARLDRSVVRRMLDNILGNALRYVPVRGHIEVSVAREEEGVVIRVANNGPPIQPHIRPSLFEKYGVLGEGQGFANRGLGLYFCRLVADGHGGSICVADRAGFGVSFEVRFPHLLVG